MNGHFRFRLQDLIVILCVFLLMAAVVMPMWTVSARRSRAAVCRNNMKLIGVGLELWKQNAGRYPPWSMPHIVGGNPNLGPWPDMLAMQKGFDAANLEAHKSYLESRDLSPEDFTKTVDEDKIFMCPADHPHPHHINEDRARAWNFWRSDDEDGYQYSYTLSMSCVDKKYHGQTDDQILSADGLWDWGMNLSGVWVNDPNASWDTPHWYSNTVGYWHKGGSANLLLRDLHVEIHKYPPDTNEVFFGEPGESLDAYY